MKLVSYQLSDQQTHLGAVIEDKIVNLNQLSAGRLPATTVLFVAWAILASARGWPIR